METTEIKTKVCCYCHVEKPLTEFFKNKNTKDGKSPDCKECKKAYNKAYNAKRSAIVARALAAGEPTSYQVTPPKVNILYKDRQSNDLIREVRELLTELRARGYQFTGKLEKMQTIKL